MLQLTLLMLAGLPLSAAEEPPLTGGHVLARLAHQPAAFRPPIFQANKKATRLQLALVMDGTTSMQREMAELGSYLQEIPRLYGHRKLPNVSLALIVYRDERSPSGPVVTISDFTDDINSLRKKIAELKAETGEPFFPEAMDQGLHSALTSLSWTGSDTKTDRRILIIGDAPPYADDHENRKHHDSELLQLATDGKITVDALLVNSGFPLTDDGVVGTSRDTATKAAPAARQFLAMICSKTSGTFLDLWNAEQLNTILVPTVVLENLSPLPMPQPVPEPTLETWQRLLTNRFASVRGERPVLRAVAKWLGLKTQPSATPGLFPVLWVDDDLKSISADLTESLAEEPDNALVHLLLANILTLSAAPDAIEDHAEAVTEHVRQAYELKHDELPAAIRDEIDALYELHINGQRDAALAAFNKLNTTKAEAANPGCRLRAAWASLALETGFWPATATQSTKGINQEQCRKLVHQILNQYPESVEGQALKRLVESAVDNRTEIPKTLFVIPRSQ